MTLQPFDENDDLSRVTDEVLLDGFRLHGSRRALTVLFERHLDNVARLCSRMLPPALAEEAAQETFVEVIKSAITPEIRMSEGGYAVKVMSWKFHQLI